MAVTKPIFMKLPLVQQDFLKEIYTEIHENPTDGLFAGTRWQTDRRKGGRGGHIESFLCLIHQRLLTFRNLTTYIYVVPQR